MIKGWKSLKTISDLAIDLRLQLAVLLILALFDVIMTMIGVNVGLSEENPLWVRL